MNNLKKLTNNKLKTNDSSSSSLFVVAKENNTKLKIVSTKFSTGIGSKDATELNKSKNCEVIQSEHENAENTTNQNVVEENNKGNQINDQVNESQQWKEDISTSCMNIFSNFAKYSKEEKDFFLSYQNLHKILKTVCILDTKSTSKSLLKLAELDVLLKKVNPKSQKLNGRQFMNFVVLLSSKIDPQNFSSNPKVSVIKIIKTFFEPFSSLIEDKTGELDNNSAIGSVFYHKQIENQVINLKIGPQEINILNSIYPGLKYIYSTYFYYEVNKFNDAEKIIHGSFSNLIEFCKNFEIAPFIIGTERLAIFYNIILDFDSSLVDSGSNINTIIKKDFGNIFTLSKFSLFLIHMALLSFDRYSKYLEESTNINSNNNKGMKDYNLSIAEKLIFFLERLESSEGVKYLESKSNKPFNSSMSFIPSKEVIASLNSEVLNQVVTFEHSAGGNNFATTKNSNTSENDNFSQNILDFRSYMSIKAEEVMEKIAQNIDIFREVFEHYAQIGDKFNVSHMSLTGFIRFLKDCNLVAILPSNKPTSEKSLIASVVKSYSKSPIRISLPISRQSSTVNIKQNKLLTSKSSKTSLINGKLTENDISIIFSNLTGVKNFDNSEKIKNQFNKNKGFSLSMEECLMSPRMTTNKKVSNKSLIPLKMNFQLFIKSFELLAGKLYPQISIDEAVFMFLDRDLGHIIKERNDSNFINAKKNILQALAFLKKEEIVAVLAELNAILFPHYQHYCDHYGLVSFDNFLEFYKDFNVFPDVVNIIQMKSIFFTLAELLKNQVEEGSVGENEKLSVAKSASRVDVKSMMSYDSTGNPKVRSQIKKNVTINFELFLDSLALAALHSKAHEENSEIEKIIHLADKMCQSQGVNKSQKRSGQTFNSNKEFHIAISRIKSKLPEIYAKKQDLHDILKSPTCFEDLFGGEDMDENID